MKVKKLFCTLALILLTGVSGSYVINATNSDAYSNTYSNDSNTIEYDGAIYKFYKSVTCWDDRGNRINKQGKVYKKIRGEYYSPEYVIWAPNGYTYPVLPNDYNNGPKYKTGSTSAPFFFNL